MGPLGRIRHSEDDGTQIGDEDYNPDYSAWDNQSVTWDETANFTGMDEYWAGRRSWDEGEEDHGGQAVLRKATSMAGLGWMKQTIRDATALRFVSRMVSAQHIRQMFSCQCLPASTPRMPFVSSPIVQVGSIQVMALLTRRHLATLRQTYQTAPRLRRMCQHQQLLHRRHRQRNQSRITPFHPKAYLPPLSPCPPPLSRQLRSEQPLSLR